MFARFPEQLLSKIKLDGVMLLDRLNVEAFQLHNRLNVALEGVQLTQPVE